jgi:AcrR family transcriptional regulator
MARKEGMSEISVDRADAVGDAGSRTPTGRRVRADAQRNVDTLRHAAKEVFAEAGVSAPARVIAERAGVGVGTLYRHFPQRADLVAAVFRSEVDECVSAAGELSQRYADRPIEALRQWLRRYMHFIVTKRGLASALHSGDPTFNSLPAYFNDNLGPALRSLLAAAADAGAIRVDANVNDLLHAVRSACVPNDDGSVDHAQRIVDLLVDGLRYGAAT